MAVAVRTETPLRRAGGYCSAGRRGCKGPAGSGALRRRGLTRSRRGRGLPGLSGSVRERRGPETPLPPAELSQQEGSGGGRARGLALVGYSGRGPRKGPSFRRRSPWRGITWRMSSESYQNRAGKSKRQRSACGHRARTLIMSGIKACRRKAGQFRRARANRPRVRKGPWRADRVPGQERNPGEIFLGRRQNSNGGSGNSGICCERQARGQGCGKTAADGCFLTVSSNFPQDFSRPVPRPSHVLAGASAGPSPGP
jgi:hypothetical protein